MMTAAAPSRLGLLGHQRIAAFFIQSIPEQLLEVARMVIRLGLGLDVQVPQHMLEEMIDWRPQPSIFLRV